MMPNRLRAWGALVQSLFVMHRDGRQRKAHAAYMAMRLAVILEAHTAACLEFIGRNDAEQPHPTGRFTGGVVLPLVEPYPDDAEGWRAIDRGLAGRCLGLPLKIRANQVAIGWTGVFDDDDWENVGDIVKEMASSRGLDAWELAKAIRSKHNIEKADKALDYSDQLTANLEKAQQAKANQRERRRRFQAPLAG